MHVLRLFAVCLLFAAKLAEAATPGEVEIGGVLRDVPMQGLSGKSRLLSDYLGKPLVINVWASWCGPCRAEMGSLEKLARRFGKGGFNIIGISTDDYRDRASAYLRQAGTSFEHYIDGRLVLENMLGADRLPLTLLVDAKGRVLSRTYGARDWDSAEARAMVAKTFGIGIPR